MSSDPGEDNDFFAHTPGPSGWHDLSGHLRAVGSSSSTLASKFGGSEAGLVLGLTHDLAKAAPGFQAYLHDCANGRKGKTCRHATPSAVAVQELLGPLALAVVGHHAGIPDMYEWRSKADNADPDSVDAAKRYWKSLGSNVETPKSPSWVKGRLDLEMFVRMTFSCLVDADYLDTEAHFKPEVGSMRAHYPRMVEYLQKLNTRLSSFDPSKNKVNAIRAEIQDACRGAAKCGKGAFRLTVPTGGGKTLSGLAFGLDHAVLHGMDRVIFAIPYTSIIDQTAAIYKSIFGGEAVLEHHSGIEFDDQDEEQGETEAFRKLNSENWDCPLVVTTTVQLFESLLHNKPSRCRKLHNIANSVLILDEVQSLPPKTLKPILDVLHQLVENYGCTVVLCTATQLDYSSIDARLVQNATEIVPDYERHFDLLKRVQYEVVEEAWSVEQAAQEISTHRKVLAVFNTRKDALRIAGEVAKSRKVVHLSTLMCSHHRKKVIDDVRLLLENQEPVCLISTQVVEAGVDFDFPIVYRDLGPLDRIIQVAGRCNREGILDDLGRCIVFQLEGAGAPRGVYASAISETKVLLNEFKDRLDDPEALKIFSRNVLGHTNVGEDIQKLREDLKYKTVAETFRLIDQETVPVVVENYPFVEVSELIASWKDQPFGWFKGIAPLTVNVYWHELRNLEKNRLVRPHESGVWIYDGGYDEVFGITGDIRDSADLIV